MTPQTNQWVFEPSHCKIGFSVSHFGITETEGMFHQFTGTIQTQADDFSDAQVSLTIPVSSIDTLDKQRDGHLLSGDFFAADQHPEITFASTGIRVSAKRKYTLAGNLTMVGVTKPVELDVEYKGTVPRDPFGNTKAGFAVTGTINRKDWGIVWNRVLDFGGLAVGEDVKISCQIELLKQL